jgi:hypothetical protein
MYFTVYKITNRLNNKFYIGVHKTSNPNDTYMGSGLAIKNAIKKYGIENFEKEVLLITEDKQSAYSYERQLTVDYFSCNNYNMKLGGIGGWSIEAATNGGKKCSVENKSKAGKRSSELGVGIHSLSSEEKREAGRLGGLGNKGKHKSPEQRAKISASLKNRKKYSRLAQR